jgi:protein-disulfide isomerase
MATKPTKAQRREANAQARAVRIAAEQQKAKQRRLFTVIGGAIVIAIIAITALALINRESGDNVTLAAVKPISTIDSSIPRNGLSLGSESAPVLIVEYGDYQCPFCGQFNSTAFQTLMTDYIATGKVRMMFSPFSFLGDESTDAAEAALCANDQGKFWEMHEIIYGNQIGENKGAFKKDRLAEMAQLAGLDMSAYNGCMADGTFSSTVNDLNQAATAAGITSTPSFTINSGSPFSFSNWDDFEARIKAALGE